MNKTELERRYAIAIYVGNSCPDMDLEDLQEEVEKIYKIYCESNYPYVNDFLNKEKPLIHKQE